MSRQSKPLSARDLETYTLFRDYLPSHRLEELAQHLLRRRDSKGFHLLVAGCVDLHVGKMVAQLNELRDEIKILKKPGLPPAEPAVAISAER